MDARFLSSRSQALGFAAGEEMPAGFADRVRNAFSSQHIVGTAGLLVSEYEIARTLSGARKEKDWLRVAASIGGMAATGGFLLSSRNGAHPEAERMWQRVGTAMRHPDRHAVHASMAYGLFPTLLAQLNNIHRGVTGPDTERPRIATGLLTLFLYGLTWKSMFGDAEGIGNTAREENLGKQDNLLAFMLHDPEGLASRLLPLAINASKLLEGQLKINRGNAAGNDFRISGLVGLVNRIVTIGYTYQQLWKAHQQKHLAGPSQEWAEKTLDAKRKNPQAGQER